VAKRSFTRLSRAAFVLVASAALGVAQGKVPPSLAPAAPRAAAPPAAALELPQLPAGVTELKFHEIFAPVGPRGLEYSAKVKELDGKRVRMLGYMVKTCRHDHGRFLLTPFPLTLHDHEMGPADDLPPSTVFVDVPPLRRALKFVPHEPGLFLLTGTLTLGGRDEMHGRRSWVRLELERPAPPDTAQPRADAPAPAPAAQPAPAVPRTDVRGVDTLPASSPAPTPANAAPPVSRRA
jgi:hypothetical protein